MTSQWDILLHSVRVVGEQGHINEVNISESVTDIRIGAKVVRLEIFTSQQTVFGLLENKAASAICFPAASGGASDKQLQLEITQTLPKFHQLSESCLSSDREREREGTSLYGRMRL